MEFEWNEAKAEINIAKHGIDFVRAVTIWQGPVIDPAGSRLDGSEPRFLALGIIGTSDIIIAVVYANRNEARRIISARRARRHERQRYQDQFGRGA